MDRETAREEGAWCANTGCEFYNVKAEQNCGDDVTRSLNTIVMRSLTGCTITEETEPVNITVAELRRIMSHLKSTSTKRDILIEFLEANNKHWFEHWLLMPKKVKLLLDEFPGEMPEFAHITPYLDNQVLIIPHNADARTFRELRETK